MANLANMATSMAFDHDYDYPAPRSPLPPPPPPPPPPLLPPAPPSVQTTQTPTQTQAQTPTTLTPQSPHPSSSYTHTHTQQISPTRRIAVQPPLITTALAPPQGAPYLHGTTPASATSLIVPFSPYVANSNSPSPYAASPVPASPMAARNPSSIPYNPQQWGRNGPVSGQYVPHSASHTPVATSRPVEITGMEASMPSPPPPYSPGQNQNISQNLSSSPHLSGNAFPQNHPPPPPPPPPNTALPPSRPVSGFFSGRPESIAIPSSATSVTSNPQFPPPPPRNGKERSVSRDKLHSKFSLSSFRNRNSDSNAGPSAIESLRINTSEAIQRAPSSPGLVGQRASQQFMSSAFQERRWSPESSSPIRPPGSRRAASAGVLGSGASVEGRTPVENSPTPAQAPWGQGVPLPPPPPGPPPSTSRSHSVGPGVESNRQSMVPAPPTRRPGQSTLTPIPPTPVGWVDEPSQNRTKSTVVQGLQLDTSPQAIRPSEYLSQGSESENVSISSGPTTSTNSTLYRTPQKRDESVRGIRERRSESRAARERTEPNNNPWAQDMEANTKPANLVLGTPDSGLTRRGAVTKSTPRSGGAIRSPRSSQLLEDPGSSTSTPRMDSYRRVASSSAPTPPFSPGARNRSTSQTSLISDTRPDSATPRAADRQAFAQASIERHRQFIEKEMAAQSDQDRLELFAEFIVTESRLRRDRYSGAFDAMAGDIMDLTRDLWRSYGSTGRRSATPSAQGASAIPSGRRSQASIGESPDTRPSISVPTTAASPASSVANFTPQTEPASPSSASSQRPRDALWNNNYHPSLSPIPSMAMSTVPDEQDSRGRSASRWWEASNDGASSGIGSRRPERSKRESKYMGLPKEARESLQWAEEGQSSPRLRSGSDPRQAYGPNEYPPEKVGLHDETPHAQTPSYGMHSSPAPSRPDPHKLDVSRLVTLPPPYPRHHPAVNNNHPELASIRSNLRNLSDLQEVKTVKERFRTKNEARKEQESTSLADRRTQLRYNIQENVKNGVMTFADAAKAENDFETREKQRAQEVVQNIFDTFQTEVANPLHAMFCERINKVSASLEHLKGRLSSDAQGANPNQTQEEGDEQPELLEMLTLLKWLFEAREQLHKEMFELEDERNDLYKDIVILPYVQVKNSQKVKEATNFFRRDAQDRKVTFEKEILKRYEDLMNVIEANVTRGVEAQLSAFWDIAPGLLTIVQKVPQRLDGFAILIPPQEYEENPVYHEFPMQYLYSLLAHAGRSAYQFIESQINLLCLLHEVKTGVMIAGSRLLETQRILEGEDLARVDQEMKAIKADEERRLTDDLKEKVGLVESQWGEALGSGLENCKDRVEGFLTKQGGWDDSLKE